MLNVTNLNIQVLQSFGIRLWPDKNSDFFLHAHFLSSPNSKKGNTWLDDEHKLPAGEDTDEGVEQNSR